MSTPAVTPPAGPAPLAAPSAYTAYPAAPARRPRIDSVDLLRGIVMVIMMLDHTRDFVHNGNLHFDPTDLTKTSPILFFTRWITHYCAPIFVFLAGTGAYFQLARGKPKAELSRFLVSRGLWLIVLEFTLVRFLVVFNLDYGFAGMAQVIWAIGWSMIVLAALIHLPMRAIAAFGVGMIALHNLLDPIRVAGWGGPGTPVPSAAAKLWMVLHQRGPTPVGDFPGPIVMVLYPLIPWIGVMAAGYAFGALYDLAAERRRRLLLRLGLAAVAAFVVIRFINIYGDPSRWSPQPSATFTVLSFLNTSKYPPSLLYLLMTLGPALLALAWFERSGASVADAGASRLRRVLVTYGRVPLFFYLLQWLTAHGIGVLLTLARGQSVAYLFVRPFDAPKLAPPDAGFDLWVVYVAWIFGVLLLYFPCRWFADVKARRRDWWLSYM